MTYIKSTGHIKFYSQTQYVDEHTGEQLQRSQIDNQEYRIFKTSKHTITNNEKSRTIVYTNWCRLNEYRKQSLF